VNVDAPSLRSVKPEADPDLDRILAKCLEKDPANRYQSAKEVAVDLNRFKRDSGSKRPVMPLDATTTATPTKPSRRLTRRQIVVLAGAVTCIAAFLFLLLRPVEHHDAIDSVAVLPFENVGADPNTEYLSDGIAESIINNLTNIPDLRVIPRSTAFRMRGIDPQEAGAKLKVRSVLAGRIQRQGDELTVQVDLLDVEKQSQLWGQQYHRGSKDLVVLQSEITSEVSSRLRQKLSGEVKKNVSKQYTENPEAYRLYLQGRFFWSKRRAAEITKAIDCFDQAIALDPSYALAYAGLADCYVIQPQYAGVPSKETMAKAIAAATKALELDNSLAQAHTALGGAYTNIWQWDKAEQEFKKSLELNPNYPTTYHWYGLLMGSQGRNEERLAAIKKARELDPLAPVLGLNMGVVYYQTKRYELALKEIDDVIAMDSSFGVAYYRKSEPLVMLGRYQEAYDYAVKGVELSQRSSESLSFLGYVSAVAGKKAEALNIAHELETRMQAGTSLGYYVARVYIGLGDKENAFTMLNKDYANGSVSMMWLRSDGIWASVDQDPRFMELITKIGLK
jgi:TolB-like protein/Tfp pilus assembly protein PilF